MKVKIIDLLNKIANGEKVPIKINYHGDLYVWSKERQFYELENKNFIYLSFETKELNDEVETLEIEEEKEKLEELGAIIACDETGYMTRGTFIALHDKVNELVKAVNKIRKDMNK